MAGHPSDFEEKEYEAPLYNQLESSGTSLIWSPGQVFEHHIGIDRAMFLEDPDIWDILGSRPRRGVLLEDFRWRFIWRRRHRPLPNFKLNLFIQAKRCFFHKSKPRHLKKHALNSPCWRFDITAHQQEVLEKVAAKISRRAVVCYAAPAFHRFSELYAHTAARTINQNSTFPTVEKLAGHSAWYYDRPGGSGVANADPEDIEGPDIFGLLRNLEQYRAEDDYSLTGLSAGIEAGLQEAPQDNPRRAAYLTAGTTCDPSYTGPGWPHAIPASLPLSLMSPYSLRCSIWNGTWWVDPGACGGPMVKVQFTDSTKSE